MKMVRVLARSTNDLGDLLMNQRAQTHRLSDIAGADSTIRAHRIGVVIVLVTISQAILWSISPVWAAGGERTAPNPPLLKLRKAAPRTTLMALPTAGQPRGGIESQLDLNIIYADSKLYNPATGQYDKVKLRSYAGADTNPERPYVAPTIEVTPGDTVRITLNNKLPSDPDCLDWPHDKINTPHCFNGTNLHAHGLWVSPTGNSDNVLLKINPGVSFQYVYNLPPDHPAGTFWYHSHLHGSTALQVSSGMAGALIVRGNRLPTAQANGDIDTLLKRRNRAALRERILVLQQIQYYCPKSNSQDNVWDCKEGETGVIESYEHFGPGTWEKSGRYTSINGPIRPFFISKAGDIERWRMIHAGVRETINLEFRRSKSGSFPSVDTLKAAEADRFITDNCTGDPIPYHVIANDGLTRMAAWQTQQMTLQPGYRSDALVVFPEAGTYCVIDAASPAAASVTQEAESRQLLGVVRVFSGTAVANLHNYVTKELVAAAERTMPMPVRSKVIADL